MTDLSIIIVTYKGWERLDKCLSSLALFSGIRYSKEVVIVDNTPDPGEISFLKDKYSRFTYIHNNLNGGYGYGVNRGAQLAAGQYLLILNPDTVASEAAIDNLIAYSEKSKVNNIVSCRQVNERGRECNVNGSFPRFLNLTGILRSVFRQPPPPENDDVIFPDWVSGSVMLFSKETFQKVKGFDEDYWMYFEDADICKRIHDSGGYVALLTGTAIEHNHGGSSRVNLKTTSLTKTEVHISRHVYISKHREGLSAASIQIFLVINNLLSNLLLAIPGLVFFFIPKIFIRTLIFKNLVAYYMNAVLRGSWKSSRSVNYRKPAVTIA